jgi:hypothetical protein
MNADTYIKGQIAAYCIREGFDQGGVDNMLAIAFVLRNRVAAGWFGGDWMAVLETADNCRGTEKSLARGLNLREGSIKQFLQQVDDIYSGAAADELTEGALFYAELHHITRPEFVEDIVRNPESHPRVATVGLVAFFG